MEQGVWAEDLMIGSGDVDFTRRATVCSLCRSFLEAAWSHAEALGVGFQALAVQNRVWVLSRLLLQIHRAPLWRDRIRLHTWPRPSHGLFALRDFEILDRQDSVLVAGASAWLVLDAASRRPQRLEKTVSVIRHLPPRKAVGRDPEKLPGGSSGDAVFTVPVRYGDIDVNSHVNSARYISWILDVYPLEFHGQHSLAELEVNYVGETRAGDTVAVHRWEFAPLQYQHSLRNAQGEEICRARLAWSTVTA